MADGNISQITLPNGSVYDIKDTTSGFITGMTILSYGSSTWQDFIDAYNANKVVYCRASSNSNPASGSQTRLAFMAYVNNATTPTEVEFQYYRSVSTHTASQQGDQVYVYKLNKTNGWSVTVREASVKVVAGTGLGGTYSNGTMTLTGPTKVSDLTNDSGFITDYTETDPTVPAWAKADTKPSYIFSEIGSTPTTINGYGITDAYTKTEVDNKVSAVLRYKGVKATVDALPSSGNVTGDVWHVTATSGEYAWDGTEWQELGTAISIPAATGSSTTGITIADHSTTTIYGVSSSTTSVTGVDGSTSVYGVKSGTNSTTTASKASGANGTAPSWTFEEKSIPNVTAVGSGSLIFTMDSTDTKKLIITHTHTAPTLGTAIAVQSKSGGSNGSASTWSFTDVTVPIRADSATTVPTAASSATTVPIKDSSSITVVTSKTHSVTDNGHTHTI